MSAEIDLTDTANSLADARRILRLLMPHDTESLCREAYGAVEDAEDHLEDVIEALADGRVPEPGSVKS